MLKVKKTLNKISSDRRKTFSLSHISEYAADMEISQDLSTYKSNWVLFLLEDYRLKSTKVASQDPLKISFNFQMTH